MTEKANLITLFLCGDVMTGRGVDQVLPTPSAPRIYESFASSAVVYVELAEGAHGPIPRPVSYTYIWGDALAALQRIAPDVKRPKDIVAASIHWGGNWGYDIPATQIRFAHHLIDQAGVDVVHGHSSPHAKGIEVYHDKPILYGCGEFLNDYEGIPGYETFRDDLALMYVVRMAPSTGMLVSLEMTPLQMRRFCWHDASQADAAWLHNMLNREGSRLGTQVALSPDKTLLLRWGEQR
jgi:poly-gamma-glutamate capsule biosynthesis protein CapA/YwtB (metallophosphatase superfamily)